MSATQTPADDNARTVTSTPTNRSLTAADAVLSLDVRDMILRAADGDDGPVPLLGDDGACVEISAGLARLADPEVPAALARISRRWLRYASLLA